jgi:hypothetical protein
MKPVGSALLVGEGFEPRSHVDPGPMMVKSSRVRAPILLCMTSPTWTPITVIQRRTTGVAVLLVQGQPLPGKLWSSHPAELRKPGANEL